MLRKRIVNSFQNMWEGSKRLLHLITSMIAALKNNKEQNYYVSFVLGGYKIMLLIHLARQRL